MRVRPILGAAAALGLTGVSVVLVAPSPAAAGEIGRAVRDRDLAGATDRVGDAVFDVADPRADVTSASLTAAGDGDITVTLTVREFADPFDDVDWLVSGTSPTWLLDVDLDGREDARAAVWQEHGTLAGGVFDAAGTIVCGGEASVVAVAAEYRLRFDRLCVGNPSMLQWRASLRGGPGQLPRVDSAPDAGWSGPVRDAPPAPVDPDALTTLVPARLLDTRVTGVTIDGQARGIGRRPAGSVTVLPVAGRGGVADDAAAVVLNVTAVGAGADGYVTVWPCDEAHPDTSHVNHRAGEVTANAVLAKVARDGTVCLGTLAETDLLVDVSGFAPPGASPRPVVPSRLLDSRRAGDGSAGRRAAGSVTELRVTGRGGVADDASAVVLNVTAVVPSAAGFITVWPCGSTRPVASSVNFRPGEVVANAVLAKVGDDGEVCLATSSDTDLLVDVTGYVPAGGSLSPVAPARVLDTRAATTGTTLGSTVDGVSAGIGRRPARSVTEVVVAGRAGVPASATAVLVNVTAVLPGADGYLTVWPCGAPQPIASTVNHRAGQVVPNAALVRIGVGGAICVATVAATDVVVDVNGYV